MKNTAALYLRSSKDRKDMSPAAQRRELRELATARGLTVVEEFTDVVVSGKTEQRPGFQALLRSLGSKERAWSTILILDTSRLARNQYVAHFFRHECKRRGVEVVFAKTPEMEGVAGILLPAILHAIDEVHSYMSREKGLAGMSENVRAGFRAGGRAPAGYRLKKVATGAVRDGEAVSKSVLEPDPDLADAIALYLRERAAGIPRPRAARRARLEERMPSTTLIGVEWNALTYAGHTVWNVHATREGGRYAGGEKRRPRSEWLIQRDTHPALISDLEAEQLLSRLELKAAARKESGSAQRDRDSDALLGGLLFAPDGTKWWAEKDRYRWNKAGAGQRSISKAAIEQPVVDRVLEDIASPVFTEDLLASTRAALASDVDTVGIGKLRREISDLASRISRTMDLAPQLDDPAPALRKVNELERARSEKLLELAQLEAGAEAAAKVGNITAADIERVLADLIADAKESARSELRATILALVERVELDPQTLSATLCYRVAPAEAGVRVASPRRPTVTPGVTYRMRVRIHVAAPRARRAA